MTFKTFVAASLAGATALSGATAAFAQAPAAPARPPAAPAVPAGPAITHGAPPPGVCVVNPPAVLVTSDVGKAVQARLDQLQQQAAAELNAERTAIENDAKALDAQRQTLDQNTFEQRGAAIQVRANAYQRKEQQRGQELEATRDKQVNRVYQEMTSVISSAYQAKQCSVLLQSQAAVVYNPAMDITPGVVTGLNGKIRTLTFDRERLETAPQAPRPAAPPPAAAPRR